MRKSKKLIITIIIILLISIIIAYQISIQDLKRLGEWKKYSKTPIIGNEETETVFDPYIMKDNDGKYRMYVSWRKKGAIAVATSNDGIQWSDLKIVLERDTTTGWETIINRASVIYKNGKYHMWYTGQANNISKIGYAVSDDGYTFKKIEQPVMIPENEYEKTSVMNPYVLYDEEEQIFKMWYAAGETYEPDVIAYATSKDGIHWEKFNNNPIFKKNEDDKAKDNFKVGACEVHKIDNQYVMFYIGYTDLHTARIFVAKSEDGITNWTRYGKEPIVEPTKGTFDSEACYKPTVIWDEKDNRWMLWYNGRTKENEYIGLVTCNKYNFFN